MQILGGEDKDKIKEYIDEDLDINKKRQIVWELIQSQDGKQFLSEMCAKNCYTALMEKLSIELTDNQIKLFKIDILNKCSDIINLTPSYFLVDIPECRKILDDQISSKLGLLVEELYFKYTILFDKKDV